MWCGEVWESVVGGDDVPLLESSNLDVKVDLVGHLGVINSRLYGTIAKRTLKKC